MIRALHQAVIQNANLTLVNIRNIEVAYFTNFFLNFSIQATILVGLICGAISQTPAYTADCLYIWKFLYFIGSAIVMALGIHMMITAVFLSIFGEGLAIRGDEGAMVRVINGFIEEQHTIVIIFTISIFFYVTFQLVGMWFVVMDIPTASISSVMVLSMLIYTYISALRIYNRFYWDKTKTAWNDMDENFEAELNDLNPQFDIKGAIKNQKKIRKSVKFADMEDSIGMDDSSSSSQLRTSLLAESQSSPSRDAVTLKEKQRTSLFKKIGLGRQRTVVRTDGSTGDSTINDGNVPLYNPANDYSSPYYDEGSILSSSVADYTEINKVTNASEMIHSTVAGYMTLKTRKSFSIDPWERRYFVIRRTLIYFYKNQAAFHEDPAEPINHRPIDLEGYGLVAGSEEPPYVISLVPIDPNDNRKAWKFRCDTLTEFQNWINMFTAALKLTEASKHMSLIKMPETSFL